MMSTPVKSVGQLLNFVEGKNPPKMTGGMNQMGSFGDVMSRTQSGGLGSQNQNTATKKTSKTPAAQTNRKEIVKPEKPAQESVKTEDVTTKQSQAAEEAGREMTQEVAKELGVTVEEVEKAMEELGISAVSLLDPSILRQLVLQISGEQDATALLTDEGLFAKLQALLDAAAQLKSGLAKELNISPEDMQALLKAMEDGKNLSAGEGLGQEAVDSAEENIPQITVEVKAGGDEIKLSTDEKGNVTGTVEVIPSNADENTTGQSGDAQGKNSGQGKEQSENMMHAGNQLLEGLQQDNAQTAEISFEQTTAHFSEQTQDIMNQIMDYMKIQLKPGMEHLEMQLHPASLGTVQVQISARGGEITAQFHVQNETVKAAIESQISTLQESFKEQGIKVQEIQVAVESHGFESNLWQGQGREENASSQHGKKQPRRINLNELNGVFAEEASEEEVLAAKMMEANGNTVDYTV